MSYPSNKPFPQVEPLPCPECGGTMDLKQSQYGLFYGCTRWPACSGAHGAHDDGRPLGVPADRATRKARRAAHAAFDEIWKTQDVTRSAAYAWLASALGLSKADCHIARFDEATCQRVIALCRARLR